MQIVVLADEIVFNELVGSSAVENHAFIRINTIDQLQQMEQAEAVFDLQFENTPERIEILARFLPAAVFINSVTAICRETDEAFIRFNGWPGFLNSKLLEASCTCGEGKKRAEAAAACLNKTIEWVPDIPGFISARVVSMIINEAYFALQENVSTKEEIDTAMKLGTNYPDGPFEWSRRIGLKNIYELLSALCKTNSRYQPAALLKKEAGK